MQVVLPGDTVTTQSADGKGLPQHLLIGPGLAQSATPDSTALLAVRAGLLGYEAKDSSKEGRTISRWVETSSKRYRPAVNEPVIGIIIARHAEGYRVDIGSAHTATLDALAFEGATKRSKPNLKVGALVYARVTMAQPFAEPEIECVDPATQKAQGFGELTGGMLVRSLPLQKCRALLSPSNPLLPSFGTRFPFETAIGVNGRIWVSCTDPANTVELMGALR